MSETIKTKKENNSFGKNIALLLGTFTGVCCGVGLAKYVFDKTKEDSEQIDEYNELVKKYNDLVDEHAEYADFINNHDFYEKETNTVKSYSANLTNRSTTKNSDGSYTRKRIDLKSGFTVIDVITKKEKLTQEG